MKNRFTLAIVALAFLILSGACATKKFVRQEVQKEIQAVRSEVETTKGELSSKIESTDADVKKTETQIEELAGAHRDTSRELARVEEGTRQAQGTAERAFGQVTTLEEAFQNRHNYQVVADTSVNFKFNSSKLQPDESRVLDKVAQLLDDNPDAVIALEGRTDSLGRDSYNILLGERRADSVIRYLVVEKGIPMLRVFKMSFGEARPIASNDSREGRKQNRTVVIRVLAPPPTASMASRERQQ